MSQLKEIHVKLWQIQQVKYHNEQWRIEWQGKATIELGSDKDTPFGYLYSKRKTPIFGWL